MPTTNPKTRELIEKLDSLAASAGSAQDLMAGIAKLFHQEMLRYNWVGFYMLEKDGAQDMLVLGPFRGTITPHTRIPLNQGICGAAASTGKTVMVDDVSRDPRYLACSIETKSEIVVPVFVRGKIVGELDIDSHFQAAFSDEDRELLEFCASLVGKQIEKSSASKR